MINACFKALFFAIVIAGTLEMDMI